MLPQRGIGSGQSDHSGPTPELLATWGAKRDDVPDTSIYGFNETVQKAIQEAAARANRSKGRNGDVARLKTDEVGEGSEKSSRA